MSLWFWEGNFLHGKYNFLDSLVSYLVLVKPLIIRLAASHVSVGLAVVLCGVASDGDRVGSDDDDNVSRGASARARVVDEDITSLDVAGRGLLVAAGASPAVLGLEAVTEVLGTDLLLAAGVTSAGGTTGELGVATSEKALGDEVGAVTTVGAVAASLATPVGVGGAGSVSTALVVGSAPVLLGVGNDSVSVVSSKAGRNQHAKDNNGFEHG